MNRTNRYVRFKTPQGIGYSLFCIEWEKTKSFVIKYRVAASFCSPKDNFMKPQARVIANARLIDKPNKSISLELHNADSSMSISNNDFMRMLSSILEELPYSPGWASRAFSKKKFKLGLTVPNQPPKVKRNSK